MAIHSCVSNFRAISNFKALQQLGLTLAAYLIALAVAIWLAHVWWLMLPAALVAGLMAVRLYVLQHDCMHRCFMTPRWLNDFVGVLVSPLTLTPFRVGRYNHNLHHSHVGDLDHRESFEINVLTVAEYKALPLRGRFFYRLYRSPITLIVVGPFLVYAVLYRFPKNTLKAGLLKDVMMHNLLLLGYWGTLYGVAGWTGLWVLGVSVWLGTSLGAVIPYVEHNFEDVHWGRRPELTAQVAALEGSAVLDFGNAFHLLTANIGFHDLHHLNPMIPSYNLKRCHEALEEQGELQSRKIGLGEAITCFRWKLWDESQQKMVTFAGA